MKLLRKILLPLNLVYFIVTYIRNKLYDWNFFKSISFDFPVIGVGNLSVGGTGKTPLVEYLIKLLKIDYKIAVLSRGYGRKSKGFVLSQIDTNVKIIGDEPFQIKNKFPNIEVAVDNNRQNGISRLIKLDTNPDVVILDDSFQHRKVNPGLSILLTPFDSLFCDDFLLPAGNLRESTIGSSRAQIIIVTKCPSILTDIEKKKIHQKLKINKQQRLFYSSIVYDNSIYSAKKTKSIKYLTKQKFTLVTGIANSTPLVNYLNSLGLKYDHLKFSDHHEYKNSDLKLISSKPLVLTTEKDHSKLNLVDHNSIYYLPIKVKIENSNEFDNSIKKFIGRYQAN
tara:strand:- start:248 stop:1261 length:1014 start_codon:yes stop_codon:yes gene_type:complete